MVAPFIIGLLVALATSVISYVLMPKPKTPKPEAAKQLDDPVAEAGIAVPYVDGTMTVSQLNVLWYGEKAIHTYKKDV